MILGKKNVKLEEVRLAKDSAIKDQEYEKAANFRDQEKQLRVDLQQIRGKWEEKKEEQKSIVDEEAIADIVAKETHIPLSRLTEGETEKVVNMEKELKRRVVGQDEAVSAVGKALRRARAGIKDPKRPIGSFLFLGPTGVGKTLLAKELAIQMFGGEEALIQVDMSEYMEKFAVSRMTGSPPGYVGHEEGGQLTERVRQRPYCVVLFDEVEKAHPDVMDLLLQILEEGTLTDSFGRKIDFRNVIVIMTSNIGADLIKKGTTIGFGVEEGSMDYEHIKEKIRDEVSKKLRPEFRNRLDDEIIFHPLSRESLYLIVELEVEKVQKRLNNKHIFLTLDDKVKYHMIDKSFKQEFGARPLRRKIDELLVDPLTDVLLKHPDEGTRRFFVTVEKDKVVFVPQDEAEILKEEAPKKRKRKPKSKGTSGKTASSAK